MAASLLKTRELRKNHTEVDVQRRQFIKMGSGMVAAPFILRNLSTVRGTPLAGSSALVVAYHDQASTLALADDDDSIVESFEINDSAVGSMVDTAIKSLTGESTVAAAWESLFPPGELTATTKVGLKMNMTFGWDRDNDWGLVMCPFGAHGAVIDAVVNGLTQMLDGTYPVENITVYDRYLPVKKGQAHLLKQGFRSYTPTDGIYNDIRDGAYGIRLVDVENSSEIPANSPTFLAAPDYDEAYQAPQRILTPVTENDFMMNVSNAKDHRAAGVTGAMKNTYGCTDNCYGTHGDCWMNADCAYPGTHRCVPVFYSTLQGHCPTVLNVLDALSVLYDEGPTLGPVASRNEIAMSTDPVTLDYYLLHIVNEARPSGSMSQLTTDEGWASDGHPHAHFLQRAADMQLGNLNNDDLRRLDVSSIAARPPRALQRPQSRVSAVRRRAGGWGVQIMTDGSGRPHTVHSRICNAAGRTLHSFATRTTRGTVTDMVWDGNTDAGTSVGAGMYVWEVTVDGRRHHRVVKAVHR